MGKICSSANRKPDYPFLNTSEVEMSEMGGIQESWGVGKREPGKQENERMSKLGERGNAAFWGKPGKFKAAWNKLGGRQDIILRPLGEICSNASRKPDYPFSNT